MEHKSDSRTGDTGLAHAFRLPVNPLRVVVPADAMQCPGGLGQADTYWPISLELGLQTE